MSLQPFSAFAVGSQLGRFWSERTAWSGGLLFAEPEDETVEVGTAHRIHSGQAPAADRRADPCASIVPVGGGGGESGYDAFRPYAFIVSAFGDDPRNAMALLEDLVEVLRPGHRPLSYTGPQHGGSFDLGGIIGAPSMAPGDEPCRVLRAREVQILSEPQLIQGHLQAGSAATDNEAQAQMTVVLGGTLDDLPAPLPAFSVYVGSADSATVATLAVTADRLTIAWTDGVLPTQTTDFLFSASPTIGDLRAAIDASIAGDFIVGDIDATLDGRATATDLFTLASAGALGEGNKQTITARP